VQVLLWRPTSKITAFSTVPDALDFCLWACRRNVARHRLPSHSMKGMSSIFRLKTLLGLKNKLVFCITSCLPTTTPRTGRNRKSQIFGIWWWGAWLVKFSQIQREPENNILPYLRSWFTWFPEVCFRILFCLIQLVSMLWYICFFNRFPEIVAPSERVLKARLTLANFFFSNISFELSILLSPHLICFPTIQSTWLVSSHSNFRAWDDSSVVDIHLILLIIPPLHPVL